MDEYLEINGIKLLPLKDAAEAVSYSRDYVARLAREQKIVASQVGRQWYVDLLSLKSFSEAADLEASVKKQQLSSQRKREQDLKLELKEIKSNFKIKSKVIKPQARMVAVSVMLLGLVAGSGFFSIINLLPQQGSGVSVARVITNNNPKELALAPENKLRVIDPELDLHQVAIVNQVVEIPVFTEEVDIRFLSEGTDNGILLLPKLANKEAKAEIPELFSDYVIVNFVGEDRGVVVYDKGGEMVEVPFVAVPVVGLGSDLSVVKDLNQ